MGIATGYGLRAGRPGFNSLQGQGIVLCYTASRPALRLIQPPIQWIPGAVSPGLKRPGREANHIPPPSAEVKNAGIIPPLRHTSLWRCA
jgi:hypothetical protein